MQTQRTADGRTVGVSDIDDLDEGEEVLLTVPGSAVSYHYFRRTEDGLEERTAATDWRPVSPHEIREAFETG